MLRNRPSGRGIYQGCQFVGRDLQLEMAKYDSYLINFPYLWYTARSMNVNLLYCGILLKLLVM